MGLKEIYGNDVILDGSGKWAGVKVGHGAFSGRELSIKDVTLKRFYPYENRSGCLVGEMRGGAIYLEGNLEVKGRVNFERNEGESGGAIYAEYCSAYPLFEIPQRPSMINFSRAVVNFINNKAGHGFHGFGGGICVDRKGMLSADNEYGDNLPATRLRFENSEVRFRGNRA
jgi:predicted outer membrane repeat protein